MPFPRDDPALRDAVARVVAVLGACCEVAKRDGSIIELATFAEALRHPAIGLTADQLSALNNASERQLVAAFWREFTERRASGEFENALGRLPQPAPRLQ